jgi:hypothetical protein
LTKARYVSGLFVFPEIRFSRGMSFANFTQSAGGREEPRQEFFCTPSITPHFVKLVEQHDHCSVVVSILKSQLAKA